MCHWTGNFIKILTVNALDRNWQMAKQYETFSSDNLAPNQNPISAERLAFVLGQMSPVSLFFFFFLRVTIPRPSDVVSTNG